MKNEAGCGPGPKTIFHLMLSVWQGWPAGDALLPECTFMPASQSEAEAQRAGMMCLASYGKNLNPGQVS